MFRTIATTVALAICAVSTAAASEADFFRGKTITMLIPAGAGTLTTRLLFAVPSNCTST